MASPSIARTVTSSGWTNRAASLARSTSPMGQATRSTQSANWHTAIHSNGNIMKTIATVLASLILPLTAARVCFAQSYCGPIEGYADLHSHLMAEYQFGGSWFWGSNHGPIEAAVPRCDGGMVVADL